MRILILGAFRQELDDTVKLFSDTKKVLIKKKQCIVSSWKNNDVVISFTGIGTTAAASTTIALCEGFNPDLIIMCGVAGGLEPTQEIGDLIFANKVVDADLSLLQDLLSNSPYKSALIDPHTQNPISIEYTAHLLFIDLVSKLEINSLKFGSIITSSVFPAPKKLFSAGQTNDCAVIDMESSAVFKVAADYDVPVIAIRAISNLIDRQGNDLGTQLNSINICSERLALFVESFLNIVPSKFSLLSDKKPERILALIKKYSLVRHPEGGWYKRTYRSSDIVKIEDKALDRYDGEQRRAGTSIIFLLADGDYSAWHTVKSDETWNFHAGAPLVLRVIDPTSGDLMEIMLGVDRGQLQYTVQAGCVFSAESLGYFTLCGCMVTPGFDFKDFKLIGHKEFLGKYPQHSDLVYLARDEYVVS